MACSYKQTVAVVMVVTVLCAALTVVTSGPVDDSSRPQNFHCPLGQFLSHIRSQNNGYDNDRDWSYGCRDVPVQGTVGHCRTSDYVNEYAETFAYQCSGEGFITGAESMFSSQNMDRRFKFQCCNVTEGIAHNCYFTTYQNMLNGLLDYDVPATKILRGVESFHSYHSNDRRFKFEICDYEILK